MKHMRWPYAEDQSVFTNFNFAIIVKFTHAYCRRRQQKYNFSQEIAEQQQARHHQITDEQSVDIERIRLGIKKEIDRNATDFPKNRL